MNLRFQDKVMQDHYEQLIRDGLEWKHAGRKTLDVFEEYGEGLR